MIDYNIQDVINNHLIFQSKNNQGWNIIYCEVCGDGSRTKGPRGGWLFSDNMVSYHCFNCGIKGTFDSNREYPYSKDMKKIFQSFSIPLEDIEPLIHKNFIIGKEKHKPVKKIFDIPSIDIPDYFYKLSDCDIDNKIFLKAVKFLDRRQIDWLSYPFYLSTGKSKEGGAENTIAKSLFNRLIIPSFKDGKMVYYIARNLDEDAKNRYLNAHVPKTAVIYGYDKLFNDVNKPLFITEGFFDAWHLNGICVLGNELSNTQIEIINKSPRKKIVVPDKKLSKKQGDDGKKLAEQALALGWSISLPEFGNCTDVTQAIVKYGKLFTLNSIVKNVKDGFSAKVALEMW